MFCSCKYTQVILCSFNIICVYEVYHLLIRCITKRAAVVVAHKNSVTLLFGRRWWVCNFIGENRVPKVSISEVCQCLFFLLTASHMWVRASVMMQRMPHIHGIVLWTAAEKNELTFISSRPSSLYLCTGPTSCPYLRWHLQKNIINKN